MVSVFDDEKFFDAYEHWFSAVVIAVLTVSERKLPTRLHELVVRFMRGAAAPFSRLVGFGYIACKWIASAVQ